MSDSFPLFKEYVTAAVEYIITTWKDELKEKNNVFSGEEAVNKRLIEERVIKMYEEYKTKC